MMAIIIMADSLDKSARKTKTREIIKLLLKFFHLKKTKKAKSEKRVYKTSWVEAI